MCVFLIILIILLLDDGYNFLIEGMSGTAQKKKPFFSCCSAQEDKHEQVIEVKDKKPLIQVHPQREIKDSVTVPITQVGSKFRFTYQNPNSILK